MQNFRFSGNVIGLFFFSILAFGANANDIWIDVNTVDHTLTVMQGNKTQQVFENIAIGRFGTTWHKITRDDKTPLGDFRIG